MIDWEKFDRFFSRPLVWFVVTLFIFSVVVAAQFITVDHRTISITEFFGLADNILIGVLVSFVFYFLIVHLPELKKRTSIKTQLRNDYQYLKKSIVQQIVFGSVFGGRGDIDTSTETIERLLNLSEFRKTFEGGGAANEGYYAFANHMNSDSMQFQEVILRLEQMRKQIEFLLNNYTSMNDKVFSSFKLLEMRLMRLEKTVPGYDSSEQLLDFL